MSDVHKNEFQFGKMESNMNILRKKISDLENEIEKYKRQVNRRWPGCKFHGNNIFYKELLETLADAFQKIETRLTDLENSTPQVGEIILYNT